MKSTHQRCKQALNELLSRALPDGGFCHSQTGPFSPEASAWAALALKAGGAHTDVSERTCRRLAAVQHKDGSVSAVAGFDKAVWCTPLCILAWRSVKGYQHSIDAGIQFLLTFQGRHQAKAPDSHAGHDTAIVGWPWIENTHSWIEPTSLSIIALKSSGYKNHPRTEQAARMILNRQLPSGGWNYGNTTVFGKELLPIPENSGQALCALSGITEEDAVTESLRYLKASIRSVKTPMALAWMLQGLALWSKLPEDWDKWVIESLELQNRYGPYDTVLLSQLFSVYFTEGKINEIFV